MRIKLEILTFLLALSVGASAQSVELRIQKDGVLFLEGGDSILFYQAAPKSQDGAFERSNYIHPLYSLDGKVLTEDFPEDHLHHRGIFWAWHQVYLGEKRIGDGWEIKDFKWEVSVEEAQAGGEASGIVAEVIWKSPLCLDKLGNEKALVSEHIEIIVYPAELSYRQIDIEISLLALETDIRIGESEDEKGYGGFSPRIRTVDDLRFTGPSGVIEPQNLPVKAGEWLDISGSLGKSGSVAGISILCHPDNPGHPNPWILRRKGSMQNAVYPYPGAKPVALSETTPTLLRYRLLVHQGDANEIDISGVHEQYGTLN